MGVLKLASDKVQKALKEKDFLENITAKQKELDAESEKVMAVREEVLEECKKATSVQLLDQAMAYTILMINEAQACKAATEQKHAQVATELAEVEDQHDEILGVLEENDQIMKELEDHMNVALQETDEHDHRRVIQEVEEGRQKAAWEIEARMCLL